MSPTIPIAASSLSCPHVGCGKQFEVIPPVRNCPHCDRGVKLCGNCRAANRLLAERCRACGKELALPTPPMQAGLCASPAREWFGEGVTGFGKLRSVQLKGEVLAAPIALDGLLIVAKSDGDVFVIREHDAAMIASFSGGGPVSQSPAYHAGFLYLAVGNKLCVFDIASKIDLPEKPAITKDAQEDCRGETITQPLLMDGKNVYAVSRRGAQTFIETFELPGPKSANPAHLIRREVRHNLKGAATSPLLLVKEHLMLFSSNGEIALKIPASDEFQSHSMNIKPDPRVQPWVAGDRVILLEEDGRITEITLLQNGEPSFRPLYSHSTRVTSLSAGDGVIAVGHRAGLTLLTAKGVEKWSEDNLEELPVAPVIIGENVFALDRNGAAYLFSVLKATPLQRIQLFSGEVNTPPLLTSASFAAVSADGQVSFIGWQ
ncbi:MAG: hypothetical protein ACREEM_06290 [Blastocatellia bacterium]